MKSDPLALLDEAIRRMEEERQSALPVLSRAKGAAAGVIFKTIRALDDKLLEARTVRAQLLLWIERTARLKEITDTLHAIREELATESEPLRRAFLRRQGAELQAEAAKLLADAKRTSGSSE